VKRNLDNRAQKSQKQREIVQRRWSKRSEYSDTANLQRTTNVSISDTNVLPSAQRGLEPDTNVIRSDTEEIRREEKRLEEKTEDRGSVRLRAPAPTANGVIDSHSSDAANSNKRGREKIPSDLDTVIAYFVEIGSTQIEAERFWFHFTANGWKVSGKTPMQDWKAAVQSWVRKLNYTQKSNGQNTRKAGERGTDEGLSDYLRTVAQAARTDTHGSVVQRGPSSMDVLGATSQAGSFAQPATVGSTTERTTGGAEHRSIQPRASPSGAGVDSVRRLDLPGDVSDAGVVGFLPINGQDRKPADSLGKPIRGANV